MATIYLARHGETEWNLEGRYQGRLDSPLTARGVLQAQTMGDALRNAGAIDAVHVSPLGRARQTCDIIVPLLGTIPVMLEERLTEVSIGSWDGLSAEDIDAEWPGLLDGSTQFDWFFRSPDGESYADAVERVEGWLAGLEGTILAISHGLAGRLVRGAYLGLGRQETLGLPVPQDVVWVLEAGTIRAL